MGTAVLPSSMWSRLSSLTTATSSPLLDQQQLTLRLMQLESRSTRALSQHLKLLLLADAGALRLSTLQALTLVMEETGALPLPSRDTVVPFALRQLRTGPALAAHTAIQVEELALLLRAYVGPSQHCLQVALTALGPALADASSPRLAAGAARCVEALLPAGAARGDEAVTPSYAALLPFISAALQSGVASAATLQLSLSLIETAGALSGPDKASLGAAVGAWSAEHDPTRLARARAAAAQVAVALGSRSIVCEGACTPPRKPFAHSSFRAPLTPLSGNSRAVATTSRCAGLRTPDGGGPSPRGGPNQCTSPLAALPRLHSSLALMRPAPSRVSAVEGRVTDSRLEGGEGQSRGCLQVTGAFTEVERALKWIITFVAGILGACGGAHTPGRAAPEAGGG